MSCNGKFNNRANSGVSASVPETLELILSMAGKTDPAGDAQGARCALSSHARAYALRLSPEVEMSPTAGPGLDRGSTTSPAGIASTPDGRVDRTPAGPASR